MRALLLLAGLAACAAGAGVIEKQDVVYGQGYVASTPEAKDWHPADLKLDVSLPEGPGPFPAVVMVHGGSFQNGSKRGRQVAAFVQGLVDEGIACFNIDYRLTGDNPPAPAPWNATVIQAAIHASFVDTRTAVRFVRANAAEYHVDPARIAVAGESAGAFASLAAGISDCGDFANDGNGLPPLEKNNLSTPCGVAAVVDMWGNAELIKDKFSAGDPPVLIIHGKADFHIGTFYTAALNIEAACKANNIPCTLYGVEGYGHGCFDAKIDGKPLPKVVAEWLKATMK